MGTPWGIPWEPLGNTWERPESFLKSFQPQVGSKLVAGNPLGTPWKLFKKLSAPSWLQVSCHTSNLATRLPKLASRPPKMAPQTCLCKYRFVCHVAVCNCNIFRRFLVKIYFFTFCIFCFISNLGALFCNPYHLSLLFLTPAPCHHRRPACCLHHAMAASSVFAFASMPTLHWNSHCLMMHSLGKRKTSQFGVAVSGCFAMAFGGPSRMGSGSIGWKDNDCFISPMKVKNACHTMHT